MSIKRIIKRNRLIVCIFLIVFVNFVYYYFRQEMKLQELSLQNYNKKLEIQEMNNEIEKLEDDLDQVKSNKNISKLARKKLKMVYPDEVLYIIEEE